MNSWETNLRLLLESNLTPSAAPKPDVPSSVLVLIGRTQEDPTKDQFILTKRTLSVLTHKGHVSFPGGYREPEDKDLRHTALRESQEEIGLEPGAVEVLGMLEPVRARKVFIAPWVGLIRLPYSFTLNPNEVDRLLYLPLTRLVNEGLSTFEIEEEGFRLKSPGIQIENDVVWGATARMLEIMREYLLKSWT